MSIWIVALAAFGGGIVSGLLGWFESKEKFEARKFGTTVLRALLGAAVFAVGGYVTETVITVPILLGVFLAGAGVDAGLKRLSGTIK